MNDELIIKHLLRETDTDEESAIKKWLASDPEHRKKYDQILWIWESSKALVEKSSIDENAAWQRFLERKAQKLKHGQATPFRSIHNAWFKVAAAIVFFLVFVGALFSLLPHGGKAYFASVEFNSDDVAIQAPLLDGSLITLNKGSRLRYTQKLFSKQRLVSLAEGEAYFQVQKKQNRPFIVRLDDIAITVLGTSFNVKKTGETAVIIVDSGSVKVEIGNQQVILESREKLIINQVSKVVEKYPIENQLFRYYVTNQFVAEDTSLQQLVEALSNAYKTKINIASEELKTLRITTTLEYGSLDKNLEVIKETFGIHISEDGGIIIMQ